MTTILQKKKKQLKAAKFKSKFEEDVANFYKILDKYEPDKLQYVLTNSYTPDFALTDKAYLECKGFFKPSDRRKMLEVIKQHPDKQFIMLFQDSNVKLTRKSKTTYGDWCSKNNIKWFCWKHKRPTKRVLDLATSSSSDKPLQH